jgi:quercetin dioxygenase-like cupin family protein
MDHLNGPGDAGEMADGFPDQPAAFGNGEIRIVGRETIPVIRTVEQDGETHNLGELRDFRWSEHLRGFMPDSSDFSISWVKLKQDEVLEPHTHPIQSMMVIYGGSGLILGDLEGPLAAGDIVVVPAGCAHGFVGGPDSLSALSIQFGEGLYTRPEQARVTFVADEGTLAAVRRYYERRLEAFSKRPAFDLLADGTLLQPSKGRRVYCDNLSRLAGTYRVALALREATRPDRLTSPEAPTSTDRSAPAGASATGKRSDSPVPEPDPVMESLSRWFEYQMYVLDDFEKRAVLDLALHPALNAYRTCALITLGDHEIVDALSSVPAETSLDARIEGLQNQSLRSYQRLMQILREAWDMLEAFSDRMVEMTRGA